MFGGLDHVLAKVIFLSKHAAAEAFGALHGRHIYDGCQLDIKCASSLDDGNTNLVMSCHNVNCL